MTDNKAGNKYNVVDELKEIAKEDRWKEFENCLDFNYRSDDTIIFDEHQLRALHYLFRAFAKMMEEGKE